MVDVSEINTKNFSISVDEYGEIVTDLDDIRQSINIILFTRKKSAPLLPTFGCGLFDYIDQPMNVAAPNIVKEIRKALAQWEPRIVVNNITPRYLDLGSIEFDIEWLAVVGTPYGATNVTSFGIQDGNIYLVDEYNRYFITEYGLIVV